MTKLAFDSLEDRTFIATFNENTFWRQQLKFIIFMNYDKPVDSFFVMGGLLACWSIMSALDK
jgi:hypothetical protein